MGYILVNNWLQAKNVINCSLPNFIFFNEKNQKKPQKDSAGFLYELENALHNLGDLSISVQSSKYLSLNVEVETQILNCI